MVEEIKTLDERKEKLLAIGKKQGYITYEQLADQLKGLDVDSDSLDELYNFLVENNIDIVSEDGSDDASGEEITEEMSVENLTLTKDVKINDPVRMYLKEIGRINLLTSDEEFELSRNQLGGLLLLKDADNISSGNELYADKLKTYSAGLVWGHTLCGDFHHINKDLDAFNSFLSQNSNEQIRPIMVFNKEALEERNKLLYEIVKLIWEVE